MIRMEIIGGIARLLIDQPLKRNAMTTAMFESIPGLIAEAEGKRHVRAILLTSARMGMFCAGADIGELSANADNPDWRAANQNAINAAQLALARTDRPTVAFIDGNCVGGGCGMALACDIRVATLKARFGITPAKLGLVYPLHDTKLLVDLVGPGQAKRILYTGDLLTAEEALRIGLIDQIADHPDDVLASITANSLHSQRQSKAIIRRILDGQAEDDDETLAMFAEAFEEPDFKEGVAAFLGEAARGFQMTHGRILCGTATTPDLAAALSDYRDMLGLSVVEDGTLPTDLAASWGTPASTGARYAILQPQSGTRAFLRLVEQSVPVAFVPTRSYGWAAFEITVQDVFGWPAKLADSGFDIVGAPKEIPGLPYFVAMQMLGRGNEMIYLNEVRSNTPTSDLPPARSPVDRMFIVILACADRPAVLDWYARRLHLDIGADYTIPYTMISKAFGLPDDHLSTITMAQKGRMPIVEVDGYPDAATVRPRDPGRLPPGNAMVTLAVDNIDALELDWIVPPVAREGALYAGHRAATVRGLAGELLELVEIR